MKEKSNKSKIVKAIVVTAFSLSVIIICNLLYFRVASKVPSVWANFCLIMSVSICYFVFKKDPYDEQEAQVIALEEKNTFFGKREHGSECIPSNNVKKLKWSTLMGPCTWEHAQKVIERKEKGWRLPTESELRSDDPGCPYFRPYSFGLSFWLCERSSMLVRSGSYVIQNVPEDEKSNFCLVREI